MGPNAITYTTVLHHCLIPRPHQADPAGVHEEPGTLRLEEYYKVVQRCPDSRERYRFLGGKPFKQFYRY